jgi:tetratricopeptide (TPR) repeat protein
MVFLLTPVFGVGQSYGDFSQSATAEELYNKGDYLGAAAEYQKQIEAAPSDPYLYYNLANSYFKAGDTDKAIVNYYRAFRLLPRDKDIKNNIAFALNDTGQKLVPEDMPQTVFNIYYFLSIKELKGLVWICVWAFAFGFCIFVFTSKKHLGKRALILSAALVFVSAGWYFARLRQDSARKALSVVARAEIRSGPGDNFPVSLNIPRAYMLTVTDTKGDWAHVETDSQNGWVLKKSIEEI